MLDSYIFPRGEELAYVFPCKTVSTENPRNLGWKNKFAEITVVVGIDIYYMFCVFLFNFGSRAKYGAADACVLSLPCRCTWSFGFL
jgi:hypothetical protein